MQNSETMKNKTNKKCMRLSEIFIEELKKLGINRVWPCDNINKLAALVAEGKAYVVKAINCRKSMSLDGKITNYPAQACILSSNYGEVLMDKKKLLKAANKYHFPYIVVDCRLHNIHTEKEMKKLRIQLKCTSGVIREYMWCDKFIVTGFKFPEVNARYYKATEDFLIEKEINKVVLLDPNTEENFKENKEDCYIVGGIVDLSGSKKGTTSIIGKELEKRGFDVISRKFEIKGDIIGVPNRINSITEILLKHVVDCMPLEMAILSSQTPVAAKWRLRKELAKRSFRLNNPAEIPIRAVKKSEFENLRWLKINKNDFYNECKRLRFIVVNDTTKIAKGKPRAKN